MEQTRNNNFLIDLIMFFIFIAFFAPIFNALASAIESRLSNNIFKHQTTMMFYISMMNWVFLPLCFFFGSPTAPTPTALLCYFGLGMIDILYLYPSDKKSSSTSKLSGDNPKTSCISDLRADSELSAAPAAIYSSNICS